MRFRRRLDPNANINMVPMIDVVFQLIIYFMVATTMIIAPGIPITLPEASSSERVAMTKVVVTVVSPGEIYLNRDRHTVETFDGALREFSAQSAARNSGQTGPQSATQNTAQGVSEPARGAVIEGNADVSYSLMVRVLDILRRNGFSVANLRTRPVGSQVSK